MNDKEVRRTIKSVAHMIAYTQQETNDIWQRIKEIPPKVTVQILAYNAQKYIEETLESVLGQSEENIEVIVRDNGSTDDTGNIIARYAALDPRIVFLQSKENFKNNDGSPMGYDGYNAYSDGYVCGARRGSAEYVTILDSDDVLHRDYIKELYQAGHKYKADIVVAGSYFFNDGQYNTIDSRYPNPMVHYQGDALSTDDFANAYGSLRPQWGKLYRTSFYNDNLVPATERNMRANIGADGDTLFVFTLMQQAQCVVCLGAAYHYYRMKQGSSSLYFSGDTFARIRHLDVLYDAGLELAKHLGLEGAEIVDFLVGVHFHSMFDLVSAYLNNYRAGIDSLEDFFRLIEVILSNNVFLSNERQKLSLSFRLFNVVLEFTSAIPLSLEQGLAFTPMRLAAVLKNQLPLGKSPLFVLLFISLLDEQLDPRFGVYLLAELGFLNEPLPEGKITRAYLQEAFSRSCEGLKNELSTDMMNIIVLRKQEMLACIDKGDCAQANENCDFVLSRLPFDREALYFKLYLCKLTGDAVTHRCYAIIAEHFWKEDADVMEMTK